MSIFERDCWGNKSSCQATSQNLFSANGDDGISNGDSRFIQLCFNTGYPFTFFAMVQATIKVYGRVRPFKSNTSSGRYTINHDATSIGFQIPREIQHINNQKEEYEFKFSRLFDTKTEQEEVFDVVAKPVIDSALEGYNGTIFAYGQTGSGKTFTITGGPERYSDRGLIPRSIQYIFGKLKDESDMIFTMGVSYLELYNEIGYDLLTQREAKKLEDLPKVVIQEDGDEQIHLRNLSVVSTATEEDALNLLFIGDTNRMIAETPSNPSSSRSHCIFIISLAMQRRGEPKVLKSKIHLVDLAGSERVGRTKIDGTLLKEARYINLSLHYLEQVIVALHEIKSGKRTHVPYRNSMMTQVLRDSIGGNCKTTMIATLAVEDHLIEESISTSRFAQRVALISNSATLNEEMDPNQLISSLRKEIVMLKAEIAILRGESGDSEALADYEKQKIKEAVDRYISDKLEDSLTISSFQKMQYAFKIMKAYLLEKPADSKFFIRDYPNEAVRTDNNSADANKLQQLIAHRDNEISSLV